MRARACAPADYLSFSYYEIWLDGAATSCSQRHGFLTAGTNWRSGKVSRAAEPAEARAQGRGWSRPCCRRGFPYERPAQAPAQFAIGDKVRTIVMHPQHHTRLPRYARGKLGVVERISGCHVFPDTGAHGQPETAQWLYTVVFTGPELWGRDADPTLQRQHRGLGELS